MKWVKCVNKLGIGLTYGKIYEVKNLYDWNGLKYIELIDDKGILTTYMIELKSWFTNQIFLLSNRTIW